MIPLCIEIFGKRFHRAYADLISSTGSDCNLPSSFDELETRHLAELHRELDREIGHLRQLLNEAERSGEAAEDPASQSELEQLAGDLCAMRSRVARYALEGGFIR